MLAIEIKDLKKTYGDNFEALKGIDLTVEKGEFFGLLGPNGAGKSTTIGILSSLVNKTSGSVSIHGIDISKDPFRAKQLLGVVPQEFNFNIFEPCHQIIVNQAGYYGVPREEASKRADELLKKLELFDKRDVQSRKLSGGLKRRLMIARALVHNPQVLILDEPTAGVDIALRRSMWTFLEELNREGVTIILTTHYLEEAEQLCKRIAIIDKGELIENRPTQELLKMLKRESIIIYTNTEFDVDGFPGYNIEKCDAATYEVTLNQDQSIGDLVLELNAKKIRVDRIRNKANRLEEMFVNLVEKDA